MLDYGWLAVAILWSTYQALSVVEALVNIYFLFSCFKCVAISEISFDRILILLFILKYIDSEKLSEYKFGFRPIVFIFILVVDVKMFGIKKYLINN